MIAAIGAHGGCCGPTGLCGPPTRSDAGTRFPARPPGGVRASYSITIPQNAKVKAATDNGHRRRRLAGDRLHPRGGEAQVAETTIEPGRRGDKLRGRRTPSPPSCASSRAAAACSAPKPSCGPTGATTASSPTETTSTPVAADAYHRGHATVELAIRDLKEGSGLSRCPSGRFPANGAWLACCVLAHNLVRWTARLGRTHPATPAHRRGHHPQPAPHSAGPPRQPQPPTQTAPAAQLALGRTPSPPPCNTSATCPSSSERRAAPRAAQPHPKR